MIKLRFDIPPFPKQRPRFTFRGQTYTPKETREYEALIKLMAKAMYKGNPLEGALKVRLMFFVKRGKTVRLTLPHRKPDLDNFIKSVTDALNGVVWWDDAQIVELTALKRYGVPAIVLEVESAEHTMPIASPVI